MASLSSSSVGCGRVQSSLSVLSMVLLPSWLARSWALARLRWSVGLWLSPAVVEGVGCGGAVGGVGITAMGGVPRSSVGVDCDALTACM